MSDESKPISPKLTKSFAAILRLLIRAQADVGALSTILEAATQARNSPIGWREAVLELRKSPQYRAYVDNFEPLLAQLEKVADENAVIALCQQIPQSKYPS